MARSNFKGKKGESKAHKSSLKRLSSRSRDVYAENDSDHDDNERRILAHRSGGGGDFNKIFHPEDGEEFSLDMFDDVDSDDDEEVTEDEAFNSEDEAKYGAFFKKDDVKEDEDENEELDPNGNTLSDDLDEDELDDDEYDDGFGELGNSSASKGESSEEPAAKKTKRAKKTYSDVEEMDEDASDVDDDISVLSNSDLSILGSDADSLGSDSDSDDDDDITLLNKEGKDDQEESEEEESNLMKTLGKTLKWDGVSDDEKESEDDEDDEKVGWKTLLSGLGDEAGHGDLKKQLGHLEKPKSKKIKTLDAPLAKRLADRAEREVAYEKSKEEVSKWTRAIKRQREAEHISFPLEAPVHLNHSTGSIVSKFTPTTDMEKEISDILDAAQLTEREQQKTEELEMKELDPEEVAKRMQELKRLRSLLFYKEQKQKKVAKIKSKTYRKIHKKEKEKLALDELQELDPELAQEKENSKDLERIVERMTLRHKNTGKWAKKMMSRNNDQNTQRAIMEQLNKADELRRKIEGRDDNESSDDDDDNLNKQKKEISILEKEVEENKLPEKGVFAMKFMQRAHDRSKERLKMDISLAKELTELGIKSTDDISNLKDEYERSEAITAIKEKYKSILQSGGKLDPSSTLHSLGRTSFNSAEDDTTKNTDSLIEKKEFNIPESVRDILKAAENSVFLNKPIGEKKSNEIHVSSTDMKSGKKIVIDQTSKKVVTVATSEVSADKESRPKNITSTEVSQDGNKKSKRNKKNKNGGETPDLNSISKNDIMAMAFEDDEIAAEFEEEKRQAIEDSIPEEDDNFMPGWGSWSGNGIPVKKKKVDLVKKAETFKDQASKRKDKKLKHVIINEKRQKKNAKYLVTKLPHGFDSIVQYERTIRGGIGKEFAPAEIHGKAIKPRVKTKLGTIINPMSEKQKLR